MTSSVSLVDLRSDTVTRPTPGMREAMASAPVGDDQFGEDPSVNLLQERVADLLGKEAALWLPTGTMANQVALRVLTRPGDHVVVSRQSHAAWHETGGAGANAGVQLTEIGDRGVFSADEFLSVCNPRAHMLLPPTTLVQVENTHNRAGGVIFPQQEARRVCAAARELQVATYLDGARIWNAATGSRCSPADLAAPFDIVSVALSKGLGAPGGSLLAGSRPIINGCLRHRRMLGGAMRQVGIFAAAGHYALDHHMDRLQEDHDNAARIARRLAENPRVRLDARAVQTNIIVFDVTADALEAPAIVSCAGDLGVLIIALGRRTIRLVTHLDVSRAQCEHAAEILVDII
jgi:threonine aldolase